MFQAGLMLFVGIGMIAFWIMALASKQVPEVKTEPVRIWFHIVDEILTGLLLIISAVLILIGEPIASRIALVALGMLTYTAIVSPGYYAQQKKWEMVAMFAVILALDIYLILYFV